MERNETINQLLKKAFLLCLLSPSVALASSTYLNNMYSAVAVGDANAGGAALANDATTTFTNPAGMVRVCKPQLIVSATDLHTHVNFQGTNTWSSPGLGAFSQTGSANAGGELFIPAFFFSTPVYRNSVYFGLSVAAPFGLGTYYANDSIVRYSATTSELKVLDYSPNLAVRLNNQWSVGLGADFENAYARLRVVAGAPTISTALDSTSKNSADAWGYGWHVGALYQLTPCTRFGFNYRSRVRTNFSGGKSTIDGGLISFLSNGLTNNISNQLLSASLIVPAVTTISAYHDFNPCFAVDGSINYTQWTQLADQLTLNNIAALPTNLTGSLAQNYKDSWILAGGVIYKVNCNWLLRSGVFWDEGAIKNSTLRTVVLPDANRTGISIGTHYQPWKNIGFDAGYTHIFFQNSSINHTTTVGTQNSTAVGTFKNHGDILAIQAVFDLV